MAEDAVILAHGTVIACDRANRAGRLHLVVRDGRIQEVGGTLETLKTLYPSAEVVDVGNHLIVPGFVNAHYHTESYLLREITGQKPISAWKSDRRLRASMEMLTETAHADHLRMIAATSYRAHLKSGTTTVAEFPPPVDYRGLALLLREAEQANLRTVPVLQQWDQINHIREGGSRPSAVLVGLGREDDYTVYSFENFVRAARDAQAPIAAHLVEQREDADLIKRNFSKSAVGLLRDFGALQLSSVIMHLNHGSVEDADLVATSRATVVLCAASTAAKQCGYPFLRLLAGRRIRCSIGTDWGSVDMFDELRFLRNLHRLFAGMPEFTSLELLRMATIQGAAALGISDVTGSIESGKSADLAFYTLADVRRMPAGPEETPEFYADLLVRSCSADSVRHVMAAGRFVVRDGVLCGFDEGKAMEALAVTRGAIISGEKRESRTVAAKPKVIAFAAGDRKTEAAEETFVEGDHTPAKPPIPDVVPALLRDEDVRADAPTSASRPGPTKEIKKVFGEDDVV